MLHYTVAQIHITEKSWLKTYAKEVTRMVEEYGGQYLSRSANAQLLEGDAPAPSIFLIIEWPSQEAAQAFYESSAYAGHLHARLRGSHGWTWLVPGEDTAGIALLPRASR